MHNLRSHTNHKEGLNKWLIWSLSQKKNVFSLNVGSMIDGLFLMRLGSRYHLHSDNGSL
uniref:Uncharacterized protein n=1 Tax=Arion vulgaris TaxID=1028688 RepID=A0A0B7AP39_9EUPU